MTSGHGYGASSANRYEVYDKFQYRKSYRGLYDVQDRQGRFRIHLVILHC